MNTEGERAMLMRRLQYHPATGIFTRRKASLRWPAGSVAGTLSAHGYVIINVDGKLYRAHRLAWLFVKGCWPKKQLDHKNTVRHDNRLKNLRPASNAQNSQNTREPRSCNRSGFLGVVPNKKRWAAQITHQGVNHHLSTFDSKEEAHIMYLWVKSEVHIFYSEALK